MLITPQKCQDATDYHDFWAGITLLTLFVVYMVLYLLGLPVAGVIVAGAAGIPIFLSYEPLRLYVRKSECRRDLQPAKEMLNLFNGD